MNKKTIINSVISAILFMGIGFLVGQLFTPYHGEGKYAAISAALPLLQETPLTSRALTDEDLKKYSKQRSIVNFSSTEIYLISQNDKPVALVELAPFLKSGWHLVEYQSLDSHAALTLNK